MESSRRSRIPSKETVLLVLPIVYLKSEIRLLNSMSEIIKYTITIQCICYGSPRYLNQIYFPIYPISLREFMSPTFTIVRSSPRHENTCILLATCPLLSKMITYYQSIETSMSHFWCTTIYVATPESWRSSEKDVYMELQ